MPEIARFYGIVIKLFFGVPGCMFISDKVGGQTERRKMGFNPVKRSLKCQLH